MMDYIKSKFSGYTIYWAIFTIILPLPASLMFIFKILKSYNFNIKGTLFLILFSGIFFLVINFLKHIKWIKIKENNLKYYSILKPFGKTLNITDYIGKITLTESGTRGSYKVVYLVDKKNKTSFKIMGLHYKNFEDINNAIQLKKINFSPTISQYFKLLFFEKITVKNDKSSKDSEIINLILGIFKIISIVGIVLFILGSLIKNFI
ncbi:hypothetical protein DRF60_20675 [Chryseobacterium elymi]|uniref:Uncharacterized protein n=1 Tax=Chryseobacterium elymi TaxID=395936 RepID=A0A3D9D056_9FLAO|nr:hypothetical protein [Chryseobacterium elymi]REC71291.1 hypothetical protein DRF60_20675 [Chryseobacterium elymi]